MYRISANDAVNEVNPQKYGVPRGSKAPIRDDPYFKNTGRPVNLWVDPYFRYGSIHIFTGRSVFYGSTCIYVSTRNIRVDPYLKYGSTRILNTGRHVIYGSTRIIRVDPYFPVNILSNQKMAFIGFLAPMKYCFKPCCGVARLIPVWTI